MENKYMSQKQKIVNPILSCANQVRFFDSYNRIKSNFKSQLTILIYHSIGPQKEIWWSLSRINPIEFENQIKYLNKTHKIIRIDDLIEYFHDSKPFPKKIAILTFDDGYRNVYKYAFPILKKYHIPATIFLTTGHIGTKNLFWWDKIGYIFLNPELKSFRSDDFGDISLNSMKDRLRLISQVGEKLKNTSNEMKNFWIDELIETMDVNLPADGNEFILSWDEVKEMNENGINFGAHTITHPFLTQISSKDAKYEIIQSKIKIEEELGQPVNAFSYPYGDYNSEIIDIVKVSGFKYAVSTIPKIASQESNLFELERIRSGWDLASFKFFVSGIYPDIVSVVSRKK